MDKVMHLAKDLMGGLSEFKEKYDSKDALEVRSFLEFTVDMMALQEKVLKDVTLTNYEENKKIVDIHGRLSDYMGGFSNVINMVLYDKKMEYKKGHILELSELISDMGLAVDVKLIDLDKLDFKVSAHTVTKSIFAAISYFIIKILKDQGGDITVGSYVEEEKNIVTFSTPFNAYDIDVDLALFLGRLKGFGIEFDTYVDVEGCAVFKMIF